MKNHTHKVPQELISSIKRGSATALSTQSITQCKHLMILEMLSGNAEGIFSFWLNLQNQNANWSYASLDEETARKFNISARTVRRIRKKMSNIVQTNI
jgi:hypothetical protein